MPADVAARQLDSVLAKLPLAMGASAILALVESAIAWRSELRVTSLVWLGLVVVLGLVGLVLRQTAREKSLGADRVSRGVDRIIIAAATYGLIWGAGPVILQASGLEGAGRIGSVLAALSLVAGGLALSALPRAMAAFALPVIAGCIFAVAVTDASAPLAFLAWPVGAAAIAMLLSVRGQQAIATDSATQAELRRRGEAISVLLRETDGAATDWLWKFGVNGRIEAVSDGFEAATGMRRAWVVGADFCGFLRGLSEGNDAVVRAMEIAVDAREPFMDIEIHIATAAGRVWWRIRGKPSEDGFGGYDGYVGTTADVTIEKEAGNRISFLAHNDSLTGLLNRARFTECLKQNVARLERYGSGFALLFLDLDQFKAVNDSRGHLVGDRLLAAVAERVRGAIRESDVGARLGGDEFAILVNSECDDSAVAELAARLVQRISLPYQLDDDHITIGVSIGIAVAPLNGTRPDQLLRNADLALYRAKSEGRGVFRFFEPQMDFDIRERRMLELELRQAIANGELALHYQPLISTTDNRPNGLEALVRWNHPIRGLVLPSEFIPIAEQSGLIQEIGDWTILEACRAAAQWPGDLLVAVNLSARHFQLTDVVQVVKSALKDSGLPPHRLELEITESLLIERQEDVIGKLLELKEIGITIAMDDFGTGYSSLSYLLKFPFDKIKIDRSFVTASSEDPIARDILRSIVSLGRTLRINITAEGVETQEQVDFLRDISCQHLQGFYFARPLDADDLAHYFTTHFEPSTSLGAALHQIASQPSFRSTVAPIRLRA